MKSVTSKTIILLYIALSYPSLFSGFSPHRLDDRLISERELYELITEAHQEENVSTLTELRAINPKKPMTLVVYMAADNDLHYFAWKNLKQMEQIGSNENINIIVQLNIPGSSSSTKRYVIKSGRRLLVQDDASPNQKLNSGSPYTLIDCMQWAVSHYPADNYSLVLWNHGSGEYDPIFTRTINPCNLFYLNPTNNLLEIDRGISYLTLMYHETIRRNFLEGRRGICFDDTFKSYISNQDLQFALANICNTILGGQKLALIGFDACMMSMIGIASVVKDYAQYMVASQEVEYGTGWNYELVLKPFLTQSLSPLDFATQIVAAYQQAYGKIINDYTLSALDLSQTAALEQNVNDVAILLYTALSNQNNRSVSDVLRKCKSTQYCTCFDEPSYIDLGHFYQNLLQHIKHINLKDKAQEAQLQASLNLALRTGLTLLAQAVVANQVGQKLKNAQGISLYFPEHSLPQNYIQSPFALTNNWGLLLTKYIFG